jgi:hypothetical protein
VHIYISILKSTDQVQEGQQKSEATDDHDHILDPDRDHRLLGDREIETTLVEGAIDILEAILGVIREVQAEIDEDRHFFYSSYSLYKNLNKVNRHAYLFLF